MRLIFFIILIIFSFSCQARDGSIYFSGQIQTGTLNLKSESQNLKQDLSNKDLSIIATSKLIESKKIQNMAVFFQTENIPNTASFQKWLGPRMNQEKVITVSYF